MVALVLNESALNELVIGDNTSHRVYKPASRAEAVALAQSLIGQGHSIDMGLAQINSHTAGRIGLPVSEAFDPCASIAAAGRLMVSTYRKVAPRAPTVQHALAATLSTYNTGDSVRGIENGYVARVYRAAARSAGTVPSATTITMNYQRTVRPGGDALAAGEMTKGAASPASWAVFGAPATSADVFPSTAKGR